MANALLLVNPDAGNGAGAEALRDTAAARGVRVVAANRSSDVRRAIGRERCDVVFVAGGDGTLSRTAGAVAEMDGPPVLGVVPAGTANDFAAGCGLPDEPDAALDLLQASHTRPIDLVRVTTPRRQSPRYFINAATAGISDQVAELADEEVKGWWGRFAYARVAVELLPSARVYRLRLAIDGEALDVEASAVLVCNGPRAGGVELVPGADPGDGLLDVAVLTSNDAGSRAALLARFALGTHMGSPDLIHRRCRKLTVSSRPGLRFVADGDKLGSTPVTFEVLPGRLRVLCPRE